MIKTRELIREAAGSAGAAHCRSCGYIVDFVSRTGACPECGSTFDLDDPWTFATHPPVDRLRFWLPACGAAVALTLICFMAFSVSMRWSLAITFSCPAAYGVLLSFGQRNWLETAVLAATLPAGVVALATYLIGPGMLILAVPLLLPLFGGVAVGVGLRCLLGRLTDFPHDII